MSVLVTGAAGFLGSAVVRRLLERGETSVRVLVRRPSQRDGFDGRVEPVVGDLRSAEAMKRAVAGVGTIYHLAATMKGSVSDMVMGTVVGSQRLLQAVAEVNPGVRLVLVSSFAVYGTAGLPPGALVDETTPLETRVTERGGYAYAKLRQERLFVDHAAALDNPLVILRPGVVYGPGGVTFSTRIGIQLPGVFLHLGGRNVIPFTYVDNCAEAIVVAGESGDASGVFNVVDDGLLTSVEYLRAYRRNVERIRYLSIPYRVMRVIAGATESYHSRSRGQLPAFFTRYQTDSNWKGCTFSNAHIKSIGWQQVVSTPDGMRRTFEHLRSLREG